MRLALESSTSTSSLSSAGDETTTKTVQDAQSPMKDKSLKAIEALAARGAHICTVFAQITTLIELIDENKGSLLHYVLSKH
jgi:hypothetical protein